MSSNIIQNLIFTLRGLNRTPLQLRQDLQSGKDIRSVLRANLRKRCDLRDTRTLKFDAADRYLDELLGFDSTSVEASTLPEGMQGYIGASVSAILRMLDTLKLAEDDMLCDVGAGLFRIPVLVHLLTGQPTIGVELDEKLTSLTKQILDDVNLNAVEIIQADACIADLSRANVFSFNLPFDESILPSFLQNVRPKRAARPIRIYPFCWHLPFWSVNWLKPVEIPASGEYYFVSR